MANQPNILDLANLFQTVTGTLSQNRETLNEADTYNHDHGDNMVDTFEVITQAMKEKKGEINKDGVNCSHILALFLYFKLKHSLK